ncbi:uracil-DNA glycosylase [Oceanicoccus sp. KOV_DT_Chl]|uniref:uracil-DNA glycosylase n=1 Tax=Oceanicoccus sp. KOV_DT_Chl TaxID=1904639 RepID=UPI000C7E13BD|nr:uracil-DNA glycosylase [Oceanicoccus sp. KOV_DT_Chl]
MIKPFKKIPSCQLDESWAAVLEQEFNQPYMQQLQAFLLAEKAAGRTIYPAEKDWFNAFNSTGFTDVKLVILGQDPYHGPEQAHGLSFSVPAGVRIPPSLRNIVKELAADLQLPMPSHGCLQTWADQGVLLLNATLTVAAGQAGSHQKRGWEQFTDQVISQLNERREGLVFLLWGSHAQSKGRFIDQEKHLVLTAPHPSPLSAHRGFLGCRHFSQANVFLLKSGRSAISWQV